MTRILMWFQDLEETIINLPPTVPNRLAFATDSKRWWITNLDASAWEQASISPRGVWSSSAIYYKYDLVLSAGSQWRALRQNTNVTPAEGADWTLFLPPGAQGPQGVQGTQGIQGVQGNTGADAYTTVSSPGFTQPAVSSNVTAPVGSSLWMVAGQVVYINGGGYYTVVSKPNSTQVVLTNLGYTGNASPGATVPSTSGVSPAGLQGSGAVSSVFGRSGAVVAVTGDYTGSQVNNTPAGNIAATNVQTALNELDTEKLSVAGGILTGAVVLAGDAAAALNPVSLQQWQTRAWKDPVTAATTGALPTNTRSGNVLTASANGALPAQDGATLAAGDSLLVKNEATGANNGSYTVTNAGAVGTPWVLTRRPTADTSAKIANGLIVLVQQGTTLGGKIWRMTNTVAPTLNTTALTFAAVLIDWASLTSVPSTFAPSAHTSSHDLGASDSIQRFETKTFTFKGTLPTVNGTTTGTLRVPIRSGITPTIVAVTGTINGLPVGAGSSQTLDIRRSGASIYSSAAKISFTPGGSQFISGAIPDIVALTGGTHYLTVDLITAGSPSAGGSDIVLDITYRY